MERRRSINQPETQDGTDYRSAYNQYLDFVKAQHTKKTYEEKIAVAKRFIQFAGNLRLLEITPKIVHDFLLASREEASPNRANKDRKNLLAFWNWAQKFLDVPSNPVAKCAKFSHHRSAQYIPPESHILSVLAACSRDERVFLNSYLQTAARRSSIFRWRWAEDIDFHLRQVRIGSAKNKGGGMEYFWLPMSEELYSDLQWWYRNRAHRESEYVFTVEHGGPATGQAFVARRRFLERLCDRARIPRFTFHALRRYAATRLAGQGVSMAVIKRILGHKNLSTTERYLGRSNEDLRETMERLGHQIHPSFDPSFCPQNDGLSVKMEHWRAR